MFFTCKMVIAWNIVVEIVGNVNQCFLMISNTSTLSITESQESCPTCIWDKPITNKSWSGHLISNVAGQDFMSRLRHSRYSQGIYVIAWKLVSCTHNYGNAIFFGKIVNFLFSFNDYSACKYMDTQHATTWANSCSRMTHGVMQVNRCPDWDRT